jgi:hypothetical protein
MGPSSVGATDGEVDLRFTTAYGPPEPWLLVVVARHPDVTFVLESVEELAQFCFRATYGGGRLTESVGLEPADLMWLEWDLDEAGSSSRFIRGG